MAHSQATAALPLTIVPPKGYSAQVQVAALYAEYGLGAGETMVKHREAGIGPKFKKIGSRVFYANISLEEFFGPHVRSMSRRSAADSRTPPIVW